jgi:hypothetical protein
LDRLRIIPSLPYAADAVRLAERLNHPMYAFLYVPQRSMSAQNF